MALLRDPFDIVVSFDTTGSMYSCLDNVKDNMRSMIQRLKYKIPEIRIGLIAHGDYDTDRTYIIKYEDLTSSAEKLSSFVQRAENTGGGRPHLNMDEAYELALQYSRTRMSWRPNSSRTLVMIGDCRPHEADYALNRQGIDWEKEVIELREMNVKIYAVQCLDRDYADSFYQKIASTTFGHHVALDDFSKIEEVLMSICFREASLGIDPSLYVEPQPFPSLTAPTHEETNEDSVLDDDDDSDTESDDLTNGMLCPMCNVVKPPDEFPSMTISEKCNHAPLECMRCVVEYVHENWKCPSAECEAEIEASDTTIKFFEAKLDRMFVSYSKVIEQRAEMLRKSGEYISVSTINGDTEWFPFNADMRIGDLKREIEQKLNLKAEQQRLIYNDKNLKAEGKLSDYGICSSANISLIMPLYCIPEHLDHVVFDLSWEFPSVNPDFLDATCMTFERAEFVQVIDWTHSSNEYYLKNSVKHSEKNVTEPGAKTGHQTIHVYLKKVPSNITHLYFTLSSWRSPNLSDFRNPSLKFYEASSENVNLCETTFMHALNSQAVIMCSAVRAGSKWQIFECGTGSLVAGNAKCYNPIRARIADLIKNEL